VRVHRLVDGPIWFGPRPGSPPAYRFDAPAGEYRTLYAAKALTGAFVETVLRSNRRIVTSAFVNQRQWSHFKVGRSLKLAKIMDEGLRWHGVDAGICSTDTYAESRRFALALYQAFADLDGIAYRARHNNSEICYALFDRVATTDLLTTGGFPFELHRSTIDAIVRRHGAAWDNGPGI
jgi:hypothetical protein